jgi:NAD(P)-dependent dehydrogenase (short-subunit alcohol dehydrogenase family)
MLLEGRVALLTGGGGRVGGGIATVLAREGSAVAIADVDPARARAAADRLRAGGARASWHAGDVTRETDVARLVAEAGNTLGPVDVLVNCHGFVPNTPLVDMTVDEWDQVFGVNVKGTMLTCREVARQWIAAGVKGAIVNISSGAGRSARAGAGHYCGSKAAVNLLTEVFAIELGPHGIRVNAVAPGLVLDEVVGADDPGLDTLHPYLAMTIRSTPLRRTGRPIEIGEAVAFLASERSGWTTGTIMDVTGGGHAGRPHAPLTRDLR